jgi:hypothetical protein
MYKVINACLSVLTLAKDPFSRIMSRNIHQLAIPAPEGSPPSNSEKGGTWKKVSCGLDILEFLKKSA